MPVVVEYLLIVPKSGTFCDSTEGFERLLHVDSGIAISGGRIRHRDDFGCDYWSASGDVGAKDQRFFHVKFSVDDDSPVNLERFTEFLKVVRSIMQVMGGQPETLWDDVSFHYAKRGYEMVYRIENLMRKLIANFMLVTIGKEWVAEASPEEVKNVITNSKRGGGENNYLNALHSIDFIHLSDFLLRPYSPKQSTQILNELRKATTIEEFKAVQQIAPQSNWTRYFASLVDCDNDYLQKRWKELYDLRCKVAHNAIFSKLDYDRIEGLVGDLQSKLEDAIKKLPQVRIPASEVEQIAENAAGTISQLVGEFIAKWRELEATIHEIAEKHGMTETSLSLRSAAALVKDSDFVTEFDIDELARLQTIRNHLVHATGVAVSPEEIKSATKTADDLHTIFWMASI